jgi:hypothetical protein
MCGIRPGRSGSDRIPPDGPHWYRVLRGIAVLLSGAAVAAGASSAPPQAQAADPAPKGRLAGTGRNPYFVLEPGYQQTYTGGVGTLVVTVLNDTEIVDGVTTRVIEERESKGSALVELSRNFYATDPATQDVYYFGEDVDDYSHGPVEHPGSWRSGRAARTSA